MSGDGNPFVPLLYTSYKCLAIIGFCNDAFAGRVPPFWAGFWELLVYAHYLPYSLSVICTYKVGLFNQ